MKTAKRIFFLLILAILVISPVRSEEKQAVPASNTRTANCLVKITCDPAILPLNLETIDYMLRSSGVGGKACREVLGISADQDYNLFTVEYVQSFASDDLGSVGLPPKDSRTGRSSMYAEGMDEYEYAMMMDAEKQRSMSMMGPSTRSSSERGSSSRTRKTPPTSRTITTSAILETEQTFLFRLNIQLPEEVKPEAEELMDAILFNLRTVLTGAFKEHVQRLRDQLKLADEEAARTEQELNAKQKDLRSNFGSRILDRTRILTDIENIRKDIQKVEMEQAADQANIDETTRQIAKIQAGMQEETGKDTVTAELTTLLQLQQQNVANMKKLSDGGRASIGEFSDAMEKLTRIRIELAQRREQLSKSAGGNLMESLNSALVNCSIKTTQNQAKLESLRQQFKEAHPSLARADAYELLSLKIDIAKQKLQEAILWRDGISRKVCIIQPPMVSVIGGD